MVDKNNQQILTIQIKQIKNRKHIECRSLDGQTLKLNLTHEQKNDPLFWWSLVKICAAQLWIPILRSSHTLLEHDWLTNPELIWNN